MYTSREEAQQAGSRVFNNGKPCIHNHYPSIRLTSSGKCLRCVQDEASTNSDIKQEQFVQAVKQYSNKPILACYFWFTFPDGTKQQFGPYKSRRGSARALSALWLQTYGYPHPIVDPSDYS